MQSCATKRKRVAESIKEKFLEVGFEIKEMTFFKNNQVIAFCPKLKKDKASVNEDIGIASKATPR